MHLEVSVTVEKHIEFVNAIDYHAPRDWRKKKYPEPKLVFLPEIESFALASTAFARGHLWNEVWADPNVGFPIMGARGSVSTFLVAHQNTTRGVIHFGSPFRDEIIQMISSQEVPAHLKQIVDAIRSGTDEIYQDVELFWSDVTSVRARFVND
jgi:hypothetical protein